MEIFTRLHRDNNNYLNTLYLYLAPNLGNWWGYRFLAIAAGIGSMIVGTAIGNLRGENKRNRAEFPAGVFPFSQYSIPARRAGIRC